jgi:acyl transferase domain-containing protein/NAD(P)H-dependent flavin oxidoreductase YrpB (nitropropane dioxygenase family)/acyl carrier protein
MTIAPKLCFLARSGSFTPRFPGNADYAFIHEPAPGGAIPDHARECHMALEAFLKAAPHAGACERVWIHFPARRRAACEFARAMRAWTCETVPVSGDRAVLEDLVSAGVPHVAVKGNESSGLVGRETLGILLAQFQGRAKLSVWGGVATAEAAAAFLATGVESIVFESVHALCGRPQPALAQRLRSLRITDFREVGRSLDPEGRSCGLCLRVFDRGNNSEVQALLTRERELRHSKAADAFPLLADDAGKRAVDICGSSLGQDELVFLGPEAAFSARFAERYGSDPDRALEAFARDVARAWRAAPTTLSAALEPDRVRSLTGCPLPFVQGAMTWITDVPALARAIAENGALPTLALGLRSAAELQRDFGSLREAMGDMPYALNILVLPENPHREAQLAWLERTRPPFVAIAAGDPSFTRRLADRGLKVLCHVQDEHLMDLAVEAGAWGVILEGHEAGGHVGEQSTLTLAQTAMQWKRRHPLGRPVRVVLAGGFATRESVSRAILLGADLVQMGTVYLVTREFVESGALSPCYQQRILESSDTCLSGQSIGLRVRGLVTPQIRRLLELECEFERNDLPLAERRRRLEEVSAGSLLLAARGVDRRGRLNDAESCFRLGQFMGGSIACAIDRLQSLADLHAALVPDLRQLAPPPSESVKPLTRGAALRSRVSITGVALATSLGNTPDAVWANAAAGRSGIVLLDLLADDPPDFLHPEFLAGRRSYCGVSAPLSLEIRRHDVHLPPHEFRDLSYSTRLTLWLAEQAVADAGLLAAGYAPERIGVFVSQNSGEQSSSSWDVNLALRVDWLLRLVSEEARPTPDQLQRLRDRLLEGRAQAGAGSMLGRLNCTAAGYICRRFGFTGPSHSTGAACAAGMAALFDAWALLQAGIIDAAVVGGGEERYAPLPYAEFCAMGALARSAEYASPRQCSRPFDARRTGFVPAGGGAIVVLEREEPARVRNAPCWGLITGMGASTNAEGLIEPSAAAQARTILASFAGLDYGPADVDLVECHATSTPSGDREEGRVLAGIYGPEGGTALCAFKSQIGHSFGASGLTALVHGLLAMRARTLPPTLNYDAPDPEIGLEDAGLNLPAAVQPWPTPARGVRRLQVDAFGFGGACYVAQVEEPNNRRAELAHPDTPAFTPRPLQEVFERDGVVFTTLALDGAGWRAGLAENGLQRELEAVTTTPDQKHADALAKRGIYLGADPAPSGLAFVCCGQGSAYLGMGRELYDTFPLVREGMDRIARAADWDMLALLDETDRDRIVSTRWQQPYLLMLEYGIAHYLGALGLRPAMVCGHSLGELIALCLAGIYSPETAWHLINTRAEIMHGLESGASRRTGMLSVSADAKSIEALLRRHPTLSVCNANSPRQFILGGDVGVLDELGRELKQRRIPAVRLAVSMAFHHRGMHVVRLQSRDALLPMNFGSPRVPVLSNVTTLPYPDDPEGIRELILDLDENTVQWTHCVGRMWQEYGIRHFVEIGPGAVLCGLVEDIQADALCIPTCRKRKEAHALRCAVARLYALGHLRTETLRTVRPGAANASPVTGSEPAATGSKTGAEGDEGVERIMRAIMKATGYERRELDLQMDLRADLGIRSIHFPVLMQELEKEVGRRIGFESLIGVSTIEELATALDAAPLSTPKGSPEAGKVDRPVLRYGIDLTPVPVDADAAVPPRAGMLLCGPAEAAQSLARALDPSGHIPCTVRNVQEAASRPHATAREPWPSCFVLACADGSGSASWEAPATFTRLLQAHLTDHPEGSFLIVGVPGPGRSGASALRTSPVFEAMTAILLTAAQEHPRCRFRSVWLSDGLQGDTGPLAACLFGPDGPLQHIVCDGRVLAPVLGPRTLDPCATGLPMRDRDVILVSGGTGGIVPHALSELALLGPRLILLGRRDTEAASPRLDSEAWAAVRRAGAIVEYHVCDIRDAGSLNTLVTDILARHGRIDGVIHAAGVSDNGPIAALGLEEMTSAVGVKCGGLEHLLSGAGGKGLRYAIAFSSLAGWFGSYGQAGYAAANRAMACLCESASVPTRVLWLPPIAGAGMADNAATRSAMHLKDMDEAWIGCRELGSLVAREILQGQDRQVLLTRHLPEPPGTATAPATREHPAGTAFRPARRNAGACTPVRLEARRVSVCESRVEFSAFRDLWIADHRPFPEMDHPLLSAVMELDCLMDGARRLAPWRSPAGADEIVWGFPVFCPEGICREGRVLAQVAKTPGVFTADLKIRDVTVSWRRTRTWTDAARASVRLERARPRLSPLWAAEAAPRSGTNVALEDMQAFYRDQTAFGERYRVLARCDIHPGIRGLAELVYPSRADFSIPERRHSYPVYLLEGAFQLAAFVAGRRMLPLSLERFRFARQCRAEERLQLDIRVVRRETHTVVSDAQCRDAAGSVIMTAQGITMAEPQSVAGKQEAAA